MQQKSSQPCRTTQKNAWKSGPFVVAIAVNIVLTCMFNPYKDQQFLNMDMATAKKFSAPGWTLCFLRPDACKLRSFLCCCLSVDKSWCFTACHVCCGLCHHELVPVCAHDFNGRSQALGMSLWRFGTQPQRIPFPWRLAPVLGVLEPVEPDILGYGVHSTLQHLSGCNGFLRGDSRFREDLRTPVWGPMSSKAFAASSILPSDCIINDWPCFAIAV